MRKSGGAAHGWQVERLGAEQKPKSMAGHILVVFHHPKCNRCAANMWTVDVRWPSNGTEFATVTDSSSPALSSPQAAQLPEKLPDFQRVGETNVRKCNKLETAQLPKGR
jgi:hypothetical protein